MENRTFALGYAHVETSASKEIKRSINLQLSLAPFLQDYIHSYIGLLFLQFFRLLFIFLLR